MEFKIPISLGVNKRNKVDSAAVARVEIRIFEARLPEGSLYGYFVLALEASRHAPMHSVSISLFLSRNDERNSCDSCDSYDSCDWKMTHCVMVWKTA